MKTINIPNCSGSLVIITIYVSILMWGVLSNMGRGKAHSCSRSPRPGFMRGPTCIINKIITTVLFSNLGFQIITCVQKKIRWVCLKRGSKGRMFGDIR